MTMITLDINNTQYMVLSKKKPLSSGYFFVDDFLVKSKRGLVVFSGCFASGASGLTERYDLWPWLLFCLPEVVVRLHVDPHLGAGPEGVAQT